MPFSAVGLNIEFPIRQAAANPNLFPTLLDTRARRHQITFDGLTVTSNVDAPPKPQRAYTQVFRTGAVEAVGSSIARGQEQDWLILPHLEATIIRYARLYMQALHRLRVDPPIAILASFTGVGGLRLLQDFVPHGALYWTCHQRSWRAARPISFNRSSNKFPPMTKVLRAGCAERSTIWRTHLVSRLRRVSTMRENTG